MSEHEERSGETSPPPDDAERVEATGETVGEAKWAALRELEGRFRGLDKASVRFQVVSEGERGLLGVGYEPARVVAYARATDAPTAPSPPDPTEPPGSPQARLRELLELVCDAVGVRAEISIDDAGGSLAARLAGPDLGLLIGKRGQTIDAIQYLANAVLRGGEGEHPDVVVDAAGYRARRQATLERAAEAAAREALSSGGPVELEPMPAVERKIVHVYLKARGGVETASEGAEPNRHVVVTSAE
jgi:spoIIIJ-associated protein